MENWFLIGSTSQFYTVLNSGHFPHATLSAAPINLTDRVWDQIHSTHFIYHLFKLAATRLQIAEWGQPTALSSNMSPGASDPASRQFKFCKRSRSALENQVAFFWSFCVDLSTWPAINVGTAECVSGCTDCVLVCKEEGNGNRSYHPSQPRSVGRGWLESFLGLQQCHWPLPPKEGTRFVPIFLTEWLPS